MKLFWFALAVLVTDVIITVAIALWGWKPAAYITSFNTGFQACLVFNIVRDMRREKHENV